MVSKNFSNYFTIDIDIRLSAKVIEKNSAIWMHRYIAHYLDWQKDRNKEYHVRKKSGEGKKVKNLVTVSKSE